MMTPNSDMRACLLVFLSIAQCLFWSASFVDAFTAIRSFEPAPQLNLRQRSGFDNICFRSLKQQSKLSSSKASDSEKDSIDTPKQSVSSKTYTHHIALKTRNIENAINFYSLLGFRVETKFISGPSRIAWLIHQAHNDEDDNLNRIVSRIELMEVPSYMLNEPEGMKRRAVDFTKREELLGLNHFALDVTHNIPRSLDESEAAEGTSCELYQLKEWMDDLNQESISRFGRSLRVALQPSKRMIGREVYEVAFLYDADGALVELLNHSGTLKQEMIDGWEPWDGPWFQE